MSLQNSWAKILGFVLLIIGVLGFFTNPVLGYFGINDLHNIVHIVSGLIGIWAGFGATGFATGFNKWFGTIYLLVAILGFFGVLTTLLGLTAADNWLHLVIGLVTVG
ncbi:MAG: DUF4383 domain-containing protein, partial [Nanoarchaeota archaeon]|nr:DUF4383 domain-containing protein [Nanoarchaeota archaeon]